MHSLARAQALLAQGHAAEALACFDQAERRGAPPDACAGGRWNCHMLLGEYELAWQQSDAIRARGAPDAHRVWDGTPLAGLRVLVRSVHGFGDALQMLRYTSLIRCQAARLTLQVAPALVPLARCAAAVDAVVAWGEERPYDVQLEITELPYVFRSNLENLPAAVPYLALPADVRAEARRTLGEKAKPRIGLAWKSSAWDRSRSIPFPELAPILAARDDLEFWSLQPTDGEDEWAKDSEQRAWETRRAGDYSTSLFAAIVAEMDLVITIDSFAAHLAGALGVPVWVLLKHQADWRWMIARRDSPWYRTMRLFRQHLAGSWSSVADVARELTEWRPAARPTFVER